MFVASIGRRSCRVSDVDNLLEVLHQGAIFNNYHAMLVLCKGRSASSYCGTYPVKIPQLQVCNQCCVFKESNLTHFPP